MKIRHTHQEHRNKDKNFNDIGIKIRHTLQGYRNKDKTKTSRTYKD